MKLNFIGTVARPNLSFEGLEEIPVPIKGGTMNIEINLTVDDPKKLREALEQVAWCIESGQAYGNVFDQKELKFIGTFNTAE